jgi:hypothetical protein
VKAVSAKQVVLTLPYLNGQQKRIYEGGATHGAKDFIHENRTIDHIKTYIKSPLKNKAMKKLISLFKVSKEQPRCLSSFLKIEFKEELVNIEMPHVGGYKPGSRTKVCR